MADVNYSLSLSVNKGPLVQQLAASGVTASMNATGMVSTTLSPGTNAAGTSAISTAALASVGLFMARNLSTVATAAVSFGQLSAGAMVPTVSLLGGEAAVGRLAAGSYAAQANLTGTKLLITIFEG
jgi:hypothetical protein